MNFILKRKLKYYTKEGIKVLGMVGIAFGFVSGMLFAKYKPVYAVTLGDQNVGYIENVEDFEKEVEDNVINYTAKNVDSVEVKETPSYELTFVKREEKTNEQEIIIAMQKDMDITYKYFEIALEDEVIDSVDTKEQAEAIVNELKEKDEDVDLTITEKTTKNPEDIKTDEVEVAKSNISTKIEEKEMEDAVAVVEGIKFAKLPVTGTISSRYGVSSRIRSSTHTGLDIATSSGTPISVVADGTVTCAQYSGAYGNLVKVSHGNGVETWYAHTSKMYVTVGQEVKAGDIIAAVGSTGNSTGPHLHFEIRINGNHVNPQNYMYN
ncbi:MAG: peptidoglycan DD-metalloendopeptidase family protein [Clostridia bacterium]|nr:peptidoglycan DD-metalloendopeptidase family protein [Clostridia bacterium]